MQQPLRVGVLVGSLFLAPMGLFGPLTGTNNAVASGAHFGVRGRIVGSFLSLLTATLVAGEADYIVAPINISPAWYAFPLIVVAFLGGLSTGITSLYGTRAGPAAPTGSAAASTSAFSSPSARRPSSTSR
ncbi:cytosine permease [Actinoplanes philippinensis]|uniref:cytosine permease n=1 Tax=Actinoplanes philippinensis TaxID=35752 RepID=UPI0033F6CDD3